jgi:hypothetical protein
MNATIGHRRASRRVGSGVIGGVIAGVVALMLTATACAVQTATGSPKPAVGSQDPGSTCTSAQSILRQVLAIHADHITMAQYDHALSLASQLRTLADTAEDDVLQEKLNYTADAVEALAAAVQAGDASAVVGAQAVLGGLQRACPLGNEMLTQGTTAWAPDSAATVLQATGTGPAGGAALVVSDQVAGACAFHASPRAVASTLPGSYRLRLWVRAATGHQKITVRIDEVVGTTRVNQATTTVNAGTSWQRIGLTLTPKAAKRSALVVGVSTSTDKAGACFLAASISMTWG